MTPQRINLITLGVSSLARSVAFYTALGWRVGEQHDTVAFFDMGGLKLGLFALQDLAADQGRPDAPLGTGAMTLAQNFASPAQVDMAFDQAIAAGATPLKTPESAIWGGHSGYFADPDGHVWELAHNPFWPLDAEGWFEPSA